jgi:VIT1/CCC1 family predicted Fe2+/Mn2+ transporter
MLTRPTEEVPRSRLWISALTIGLSYFIGGLVPLFPYMGHTHAETALIISACITGFVLFIFGGVKTYFTGAKGGWLGYLYGATSMALVGGLAAGSAYGLVRAMGVHQ